jgi:hypothetical protein
MLILLMFLRRSKRGNGRFPRKFPANSLRAGNFALIPPTFEPRKPRPRIEAFIAHGGVAAIKPEVDPLAELPAAMEAAERAGSLAWVVMKP